MLFLSDAAHFQKTPIKQNNLSSNMLVLAQTISADALVLECAANFEENH